MPDAAATLPPTPAQGRRLRFYFGWVNVGVAALAMVATLPGRTQGLGLITESLLTDLNLDRSGFAELNLVATCIGSAACVGFGRLVDRWGTRLVMTLLCVALGGVVLGMASATALWTMAMAITLTRALGQSALSVTSLSVTPQWFDRRLPQAVAVYTVVLSLGFMIAFPVVGSMVTHRGWRSAWSAVGWCLLGGMAPLAWMLLRPGPVRTGEEFGTIGNLVKRSGSDGGRRTDATLREALATPEFWVFALGAALYGLVASGIGLFNESILQERGFPSTAYHQALAATALAGLAGNFLGGWLAERRPLSQLMAISMALLGIGLLALPHLRTFPELMLQAVLMGVAGGFVSVLFFSVWAQRFGTRNVGQIQGGAQMLTVLGSAVGPLVLASVVSRTGSYASAFRGLAVAVFLVSLAAWRLPGQKR